MKSSRERLLVALLPGIVILGLYGWTMNRRLHGDLGRARERVATSQETLGSLGGVDRLRHELRTTQKRVDLLEGQLKTARASLPAERSEAERARSVGKLSEVLSRNGLAIASEAMKEVERASLPGGLGGVGQEPEARKASSSSTRRRSSSATTAEPRSSRKVGLWEIVFSGEFANVERAMAELSRSAPEIVPISLQMEEASLNETTRTWRLVVWP